MATNGSKRCWSRLLDRSAGRAARTIWPASTPASPAAALPGRAKSRSRTRSGSSPSTSSRETPGSSGRACQARRSGTILSSTVETRLRETSVSYTSDRRAAMSRWSCPSRTARSRPRRTRPAGAGAWPRDRLEGPLPIPRHVHGPRPDTGADRLQIRPGTEVHRATTGRITRLETQMGRHLRLQSGLQHLPGRRRHQPALPSQMGALAGRCATSCWASLDGSGDTNGRYSAAGKTSSVMSVITKVSGRAGAVHRLSSQGGDVTPEPKHKHPDRPRPGHPSPFACPVDPGGFARRRATDWRPARLGRISSQAGAAHAADHLWCPPDRFNSVDPDGTPNSRASTSEVRHPIAQFRPSYC